MTTIKVKRGTAANRLGILPEIGELIYTTDDKKLYVGDGTTNGGISIGKTAAEILTLVKTVDGTSSGLDADLLDGQHRSGTATGNTVASRDSSGDINARLFRSEYDTTNPTINYVMTQIDTASNNFVRPSTIAQLRTSLNVEDGSTGDQSAAEILASLSTVDGAGSGLDADLLDGVSSAGYTVANPVDYSGDMNSLFRQGTYRINNTATNLPSADFFACVVYGNNGNVTSQLITHFTSGATYIRAYNTVWPSWALLSTGGGAIPTVVSSGTSYTKLSNGMVWYHINTQTFTANQTRTFTLPVAAVHGKVLSSSSSNAWGRILSATATTVKFKNYASFTISSVNLDALVI